MEMASLDELSSKTRYLENEIEGEKVLTRHIFDSTRRHAEELSALRVEIATLRLVNERIGGDVALVKTAQMSQGQTLNILVQDVREMRTEIAHIRTEIRTEMGQIRSEIGTEIGQTRTEFKQEIGTINHRLDAMERSIAAILAAVVPGSPPPA
jgi:hypothetical protein